MELKEQLLDIARETKVIDPTMLENFFARHAGQSERIDLALLNAGHIAEEQILALFSRYLDIPLYSQLKITSVPEEFINKVPSSYAQQHSLLAIEKENGAMTVVTSQPLSLFALDNVGKMLDCAVRPALATRAAISSAINAAYEQRVTVLEEVAALLEAEFLGLREVLHAFSLLPPSFDRFRFIVRQAMRVLYPPAGWETEWVEDSPRRIAFNMRRCFYLDVLPHYGVPELPPLYCRLDDLVYAELPPYIRFERGKTLGRGDACCDFAYVQSNGEIPIPLDQN